MARDFEQEGRDAAAGKNTGGYPTGGGYASTAGIEAGCRNPIDQAAFEDGYQETQQRSNAKKK